jgi:hypothetical protein
MRVEIIRNETSRPIVYEGAVSTYTKGNLYCVLIQDGEERVVHKYPFCSLFGIEEEY